jgi:hypothetical protein
MRLGPALALLPQARVALASALVAAAVGCASSNDSSGAGGGATTSAAGGSGGSGSATTTTSTTTTTTTTSSAGGVGGGPSACAGAFKFPQAACGTCLEDACCDALAACAKDAACSSCVTTGDAKDCTKAKALAGAVEDCRTVHCKKPCSPAPPPVACSAPTDFAKAPSGGKCVTIDKQAVACNPVTQEGCDAKNGEACDVQKSGGNVGFQCYPGKNDAKLCGECDGTNGPFCAPGTSCDGTLCARFCCADADCGAGATCDKSAFSPAYDLGVCHTAGAQKDGGA